MKALAFIGEIDATYRLQVQVLEALPPGLGRMRWLVYGVAHGWGRERLFGT